MTYLQDPDVTLYHGDALEVLRTLPDRSVHMCATSPPFYGLRDYGTGTWEGGDEGCEHMHDGTGSSTASSRLRLDGRTHVGPYENEKDTRKPYGLVCGKCGARRIDRQIGLEESPDEWVARLVEVFREVRRVLRDDGTLWVEIGDSYASTQKGGGGDGSTSGLNAKYAPDGRFAADNKSEIQREPSRYDLRTMGLKQKDLIGQPWLLAQALRDPYYTGKIKREADRVWLAAMVDGEGSIGIHKRPAGQSAYSSFQRKDGTKSDYVRTQDSYQPKLEISNTNLALIERIVALTGEGNTKVKQEAGTHGRKQTIYRWTVTADKCRDLLRELYPHLVAKQHEARMAYGCPPSGMKAAAAHEALKALHQGEENLGTDFPHPESLYEAGWFLRSEIIWARLHPNPMPESVTDRPTKAHSTVFLLSKMPRYYFDAEAIREPEKPWAAGLTMRRTARSGDIDNNTTAEQIGKVYDELKGANARSVWNIATEPTPFAHFATWPQKLCRRMILAGCPEGGIVLDPFGGSGTTALVARKLHRKAVLIELNAEYCELTSQRLAQQSLFADVEA